MTSTPTRSGGRRLGALLVGLGLLLASGAAAAESGSPAAAPIRINFQPAAVPQVDGHLVDSGLVFSAARGHGWSRDISSTARDRNRLGDQLRDTLLQCQRTSPSATWRLTLPSGTYAVTLGVGDPSYQDSVYRVTIEGQPFLDFTPTSDARSTTVTRTVTVSDGALDLASGAGASNNKVQFIQVVPATQPGSVATPVFSPSGGSFSGSQTVSLACGTTGATIRYTLDGSTPTATSGTVYGAPFTLTATATAKAIAVKTGATSSSVAQAVFTRLNPLVTGPPSRAEAARFLNQATFGARAADIDRLMAIGYDAWFDEQFAQSYQGVLAWLDTDTKTAGFQGRALNSAFQTAAVQSPAQLRMRMVWALSQIFVVTELQSEDISMKYWVDMLQRNCFTTYRSLLEEITYHGSMAQMLSYFYSRDLPAQNIFPDQNYAREILQLFSIGLYQLELDGSLKLDGTGKPIQTYTSADIVNLARVWTGFLTDYSDSDPNRSYWTRYARRIVFLYDNHSSSEKRFLGTTIPAYTGPTPMPDSVKHAEVRTALDTIAGHPNVAPFISRQLIQRFVTSNPSPAYVKRVATVFTDNGAGVRGDFKAVIKAVLLDPEARDRAHASTTPQWGKLREEMLLAMPLMRVLHTRSAAANGGIYDLNANSEVYGPYYSRVKQEAFKAPSVFNFYRPGFTPPLTRLGDQGFVGPEFQTLDSLSLLAWSRYLGRCLDRDGTGPVRKPQTDGNTFDGDGRGYNQFDYREFEAVAGDPQQLADRVDELLFGGMLPAADKAAIRDQAARVELTDQRLFIGTTRPARSAPVYDTRHELGMRFMVGVPGTIRAIRYYRPAGESGTHIGRLWTSSGTQLGQATFTDETAEGWQQAALATPVAIQPGTVYVVSVNANVLQAETPAGFSDYVPFGVFRLPADNEGHARFSVSANEYPAYNTYTNFHRDVVFQAAPEHTATATRAAATTRIKRALFLAMLHPQYLVQK